MWSACAVTLGYCVVRVDELFVCCDAKLSVFVDFSKIKHFRRTYTRTGSAWREVTFSYHRGTRRSSATGHVRLRWVYRNSDYRAIRLRLRRKVTWCDIVKCGVGPSRCETVRWRKVAGIIVFVFGYWQQLPVNFPLRPLVGFVVAWFSLWTVCWACLILYLRSGLQEGIVSFLVNVFGFLVLFLLHWPKDASIVTYCSPLDFLNSMTILIPDFTSIIIVISSFAVHIAARFFITILFYIKLLVFSY